jgi:hypothetical protein
VTGAAFSVGWERPLVEAVVLAAVRGRPEEARFLGERERQYEIADPEAREEAFAALHRAWFERLGLDQPLASALAECPGIAGRCGRGIVARAFASADEAADLLVAPPAPPTVLVRVRAATVCVPERFLRLLRPELLHVADMLDPAFGYEPRLPPAEDGLDRGRALADRYRVLWDAFVDGRLLRAGRAPASVRAERRADFARAFGELGAETDAVFARFFSATDLTHVDLVAFARGAGGARPAELTTARLP